MPTWQEALSILLCASLTISTIGLDGCNKQGSAPNQSQQGPAATNATPTADQLYQLVAPIALFPDNLLAQVLAGSTFPDQITAAYQWLQQNSNLKGEQLMQAVNQQTWDASVKGLTQFPDVLKQMSSNLSWTSALGDAYVNVPQSVMNAVQVMRERAYSAGNLKNTPQQNVSVQNQAPGAAPPPPEVASSGPQTTIVQPPAQTIVIQPSQPDVVYVPTYNPTVVYGAPVAAYPGYSTGDLVATSLISFGVGMAVGAAMSGGCCGWGYNSWGCGWHNSTVVYNHNTYISNSNTFVNRNNYYNRNNINNANINRNNVDRNNYRANNFNSNARNSNFSTPTFNQKYDQKQFQNNRNNPGQNNRQQLGGASQPRFDQNQNRAGLNDANRGGLNQQNRPGTNPTQSRANLNQTQNRPNFNQQQRDPARGYGQQADRGTNTGAFSNYSPGGNARTNSARGQQSLAENRSPQGGNFGGNRGNASRPQPHRGGRR